MQNIVLGVVGQGFVGNAFREGMKDKFTIETYDKYVHDRSTCSSIDELVEKSDVIFVSVPTPMRKTGECDTSIVESVLCELYSAVKRLQSGVTLDVVIRSTVPPGTTERLNKEYSSYLNVIFNPEFLTEVNAIDDFKNQNRIILGYEKAYYDAVDIGNSPGRCNVYNVYAYAFPGIDIITLYSTEAEMVKYTTNVFLATKVSLANELWQVCQAVGVDYDVMIDAAKLDKRLGQSHWMVPGLPQVHDPVRRHGFGGSCFVKDLNALKSLAKSLDVDPKIMEAVWQKNLEIRTGDARDWEKLEGRAISGE